MTIKEYFLENIDEPIDEKLYLVAKSSLRHSYLFVFSIILFALAFACGLSATVVIIFDVVEGYYGEVGELVGALFIPIPLIIGAIVLMTLNNKNRENVEKYDYVIKKYVELCLNNKNIPDSFWNLEYDEAIINYKVTNRKQNKKLLIDYNDDENSIRIFSDHSLSKPISLSDIIEYDLLDENRVVCSCKKGNSCSTRKVIYNRFECDNLVLQFQTVDSNNHITTHSYTILSGIDRDDQKFKKAINFLIIIFNQLDALLIDKNAKANGQTASNDSTYDKLLQLKRLLDDGIIDQTTYEEKKNKLVEEL